MPYAPQLADVIADEVTDAIFQRKTAMTARKETMMHKHVRECVHGVLVRRLPGAAGAADAKPLTPAERLYAAYPRHIAKKAALKAIAAALKDVPLEDLLAKVQAYKAATDRWPAIERQRFIPHPATWFNRGSYADDPKEWERGQPATTAAPQTYERI